MIKRIWKKIVDVWNNDDCFFHTYSYPLLKGERIYCVDCGKPK